MSMMQRNEIAAIKELKKSLEQNVVFRKMVLFGSKVRGDSSLESDIDVMIEVNDYSKEIENLIDTLVFEINLKYDCFISTVIFGREELEEGPLKVSPLYQAIIRDGITQ